ncbi:MAG: DUF2303 family protein [Arcobacter sp.]|uniref:DUF2303 family protein n=1 Tax=Arcobacter sp. TaxID=1872629 RepID=UPI003C7464B3
MIKEAFIYLMGLNKPVETLDDGREVVHENYKVQEDNRGINFKHEIVRHVINQSILNKEDFIKFINEYKTDETKIFFDDRKIKAVFNYSTKSVADHNDSYCSMELEHTKNFIEFTQCLDRDLSQKEFVRILKRLESCIVGFNGKPVDDMDIIDVAEHLHSTKNFNSLQRNTAKAFTVDATVTAGNESYDIPRFIHFKLPVYKNDKALEVEFVCELFLEAADGGFFANLVCYKLDDVIEETIKKITQDVCSGSKGVESFMI